MLSRKQQWLDAFKTALDPNKQNGASIRDLLYELYRKGGVAVNSASSQDLKKDNLELLNILFELEDDLLVNLRRRIHNNTLPVRDNVKIILRHHLDRWQQLTQLQSEPTKTPSQKDLDEWLTVLKNIQENRDVTNKVDDLMRQRNMGYLKDEVFLSILFRLEGKDKLDLEKNSNTLCENIRKTSLPSDIRDFLILHIQTWAQRTELKSLWQQLNVSKKPMPNRKEELKEPKEAQHQKKTMKSREPLKEWRDVFVALLDDENDEPNPSLDTLLKNIHDKHKNLDSETARKNAVRSELEGILSELKKDDLLVENADLLRKKLRVYPTLLPEDRETLISSIENLVVRKSTKRNIITPTQPATESESQSEEEEKSEEELPTINMQEWLVAFKDLRDKSDGSGLANLLKKHEKNANLPNILFKLENDLNLKDENDTTKLLNAITFNNLPFLGLIEPLRSNILTLHTKLNPDQKLEPDEKGSIKELEQRRESEEEFQSEEDEEALPKFSYLSHIAKTTVAGIVIGAAVGFAAGAIVGSLAGTVAGLMSAPVLGPFAVLVGAAVVAPLFVIGGIAGAIVCATVGLLAGLGYGVGSSIYWKMQEKKETTPPATRKPAQNHDQENEPEPPANGLSQAARHAQILGVNDSVRHATTTPPVSSNKITGEQKIFGDDSEYSDDEPDAESGLENKVTQKVAQRLKKGE